MKRLASLLLAFLLIGIVSPASAQNWSELKDTRNMLELMDNFNSKMKVISDTADYIAVVPKPSEPAQFQKGDDELPAGMEKLLSNNSSALIQLAKKADEFVINGLQDESGPYINSLGERRARTVAKEFNELIWHDKNLIPKISTQEYPLANAPKTGVLREHQQYLNQRSVAFVARFDANTQNDYSWLYLPLLLLTLLPVAGLALGLWAWSQLSDDQNGNESASNSDTTPGEDDGNDPAQNDNQAGVGVNDEEPENQNINIFLYQEVNNEGDGDVNIDVPPAFMAEG